RAAPVRIVRLQELVENDGLPQIDVHFAELAAEHGEEGPHQTEDAFLLLRAAGEFADVGSALDDAFIAEIYGHEHHGTPRLAQVAAHGHRQHSRARRQQSAGAAAAAFNEV